MAHARLYPAEKGGRGKLSSIRESLSRSEENTITRARYILARSPMRADEVMATIPYEGHGTGKTHAPRTDKSNISISSAIQKNKTPVWQNQTGACFVIRNLLIPLSGNAKASATYRPGLIPVIITPSSIALAKQGTIPSRQVSPPEQLSA